MTILAGEVDAVYIGEIKPTKASSMQTTVNLIISGITFRDQKLAASLEKRSRVLEQDRQLSQCPGYDEIRFT